jgi:hypothetical protein
LFTNKRTAFRKRFFIITKAGSRTKKIYSTEVSEMSIHLVQDSAVQNKRTGNEAASQADHAAFRLGGYAAIGGAVTMIIGAAILMASGVDLDLALATDDMADYLVAAGEAQSLVVANLVIWIVGVLIFGVAGTAMTAVCTRRRTVAQVARYCYWAAVPLVVAAYVAWLALVVQIAPDNSQTAVLIAEVIGWFASRADWVATILIISVGPALISLAGRGDWVPKWLVGWGIVALFPGLLTAVAMLTGGNGLTSYGLLILPVGLSWTIAAGIVLLRRERLLNSTVEHI